jgi:hypothetical protein
LKMLFRIDHRDRVATVDEEWATLARESGADPLCPGAEVGRPYRDFIRNNQVAEVYRIFLERVRLRREVVRFPVRADTAREKRFFLLEIEAVEGGAIELRLKLEGTEPRAPGDWSTPPEEDEMIRMCSFCQRAQWDLEWMELAEAMEAGDLFGAFTHWQISHGSCPDCLKERMLEITGG